MCGIGQTEISVRVKAVTPNHGSCSIQVLFVPGLGFSLVASLLTKTPRLEALPLATSRKAIRCSDLASAGYSFLCIFYRYPARVLEISPFALKKPASATASFSGASFFVSFFALRFSSRETRATLECKGPREGEK